MTEQTIIAYPTFIADLGGAQWLRLGKRSSHVKLANGREIRVPTRKVYLIRDDGLAVAEAAKAHAYCAA